MQIKQNTSQKEIPRARKSDDVFTLKLHTSETKDQLKDSA